MTADYLAAAVAAGIQPREFWRLTPWEVTLVTEAKAIADEGKLELVAWQTALLLNVHVPRGKPRVTVDKLLGRVVTVRSGAAARAHMEKVVGDSTARDAGG